MSVRNGLQDFFTQQFPEFHHTLLVTGGAKFTALINALPEAEQEIYMGYGDLFREGYVKLNQGFFEDAVTLLSQSLEANASAGGFIRLELATAHDEKLYPINIPIPPSK